MAVVIAQLSDFHLRGRSDQIFARLQNLGDAIAAEADQSASDIVLLVTGDVANSGATAEFEAAHEFLSALEARILPACRDAKIHRLSIPGNHDCDFSGDQALRDLALRNLESADLPPASIAGSALSPLSHYFVFAKAWVGDGNALSVDQPYYRAVDIRGSDSRVLRFHLLNSAWMSTRNELPGSLTFPISAIATPDSPDAGFSIAAIHHPYNWFRQPEAMRPLRERLEEISDLILTGHEHVPGQFQIAVPGKAPSAYLAGGALAEVRDPKVSSFNVIRLDFDNATQTICNYRWEGEYYRLNGGHVTQPLGSSAGRIPRRLSLAAKFEDFLDAPELPLSHDSKVELRLQDFYTYPDLREIDPSEGATLWRRIRADDVVAEALRDPCVLMTGAEKSGKSSLLKTMFRDLLRRERVPVLLDGTDLHARISHGELRKAIGRCIKSQYSKLTSEQFEQIDRSKKVLLIDNWDRSRLEPTARRDVIEYLCGISANVIATATDTLCMQGVDAAAGGGSAMRRLDICEFGHTRLERLAAKWLSVGGQNVDREVLASEAKRICKKIEQALRSNGIPHHPWILVVLLKQVDSLDQTAAKNGSYGHLYNAVITAALHGSRFNAVDIKTKYTYLANFASVLHARDVASISNEDMRAVHEAHCRRYDFAVDYAPLRDDLIATGMLRNDGGQIAFRAKYTYCFFLAWHLANAVHKSEARSVIEQLSNQLFHEESADTIVFLAHLSSNPVVLDTMVGAAAKLFRGLPAASLGDEVKFLDDLMGGPPKLALPDTTPKENMEKSMDQHDDHLVQRGQSGSDGRDLQPHPVQEQAEWERSVHELQSAKRTVQILGQVLRNEAGAIEGEEKLRIVTEIFALTRRMISELIVGLRDNLSSIIEMFADPLRREALEGLTDAQRAAREAAINKKADAEARKMVWGLAVVITYFTLKHLSESVGLELLEPTFTKLLGSDPAVPNRLAHLAITFDYPRAFPTSRVVSLDTELKVKDFARTSLRLLVLNHLYLYEVPHNVRQTVCSKLEIEPIKRHMDPDAKLVGAR